MIILSIIFLITGFIVLYRGQYEKSTFLDRPLIMDSVIFTFIANISTLLVVVTGVVLTINSWVLILVLLVVLHVLNFLRKKITD